jgi:threonine aldolase
MKIVPVRRGFASDNNAGVHPEILKGIIEANEGHVLGYGGDDYTAYATGLFREHLGESAEVFFVFNGTAANVLGLTGITRQWNSIITAFTAHIEQDECGAPERFTGCKLLTVDTADGKISKSMVERHIHGFDFEHHSQPKVISISQATEMGTVYSPEEIRDLAGYAHSKGLLLHMDGARISNASVTLDLPFRTFTTDAGVDVISFGGTKNGMMYGEAICFLKPGLAGSFKYIRKQGMQLASKMRYISSQYISFFRDDLWKKLASHSNKMARLLGERLKDIAGLTINQPIQSNAVFISIPHEVADKVRKRYFFYPWNEEKYEYRLMTSWDTSEEDIEIFVSLLRNEMLSGK